MAHDDPITIGGLEVPYAVHRRWVTKVPATADQAAAFAAGHAGEVLPPGARAWSAGRAPAWYTRGQALRKWEEGTAEREAAAAERETRRERDRTERLAEIRKAQDEGRSAWRRGKSLRACPHPGVHRLRKHWRAGWLAAQEEAYRRSLP